MSRLRSTLKGIIVEVMILVSLHLTYLLSPRPSKYNLHTNPFSLSNPATFLYVIILST